MGADMWIVCHIKINGVDSPRKLLVASSADPGAAVKIRPGVGKPYWAWHSMPVGAIESVDFTDAPIVSTDTQVNNENIANIEVSPEDVIVFAES